MKCTKIPENTFKSMQLNAGVVLTEFDPKTPTISNDAIFAATSGGAQFKAAAEYEDRGEGIDNCPPNMMELKKLKGWKVDMTGTAKTVTTQSGKKLIAACDIDPEDPTHLIPRRDVIESDFGDIWWVGDYGDKNSDDKGGFIAIHVMNALNIGGFDLKSNDDGTADMAFDFVGHVSIKSQDIVPFEVYIVEGTDDDGPSAASYFEDVA